MLTACGITLIISLTRSTTDAQCFTPTVRRYISVYFILSLFSSTCATVVVSNTTDSHDFTCLLVAMLHLGSCHRCYVARRCWLCSCRSVKGRLHVDKPSTNCAFSRRWAPVCSRYWRRQLGQSCPCLPLATRRRRDHDDDRRPLTEADPEDQDRDIRGRWQPDCFARPHRTTDPQRHRSRTSVTPPCHADLFHGNRRSVLDIITSTCLHRLYTLLTNCKFNCKLQIVEFWQSQWSILLVTPLLLYKLPWLSVCIMSLSSSFCFLLHYNYNF